MALTSVLVQAATAEADGDSAGGVGDAEGLGVAVGDGLGGSGLPHAVRSAVLNMARTVRRKIVGRRVRGIVDRIIRLRPCGSDDPSGVRSIGPSGRVLGLVLVVGSTRTTLRGRLPRVLRVAELALCQVVEAILLAPKDVELVFALLRLEIGSTGRRLVAVGRPGSTQQSTEKAHWNRMLREWTLVGVAGAPAGP